MTTMKPHPLRSNVWLTDRKSPFGGMMKIKTSFWAKPIPDRRFDWSAIDEDTYDGTEDSGTRGQVGFGATEQEAIAELMEILGEAS
jgi:hypothetical protein